MEPKKKEAGEGGGRKKGALKRKCQKKVFEKCLGNKKVQKWNYGKTPTLLALKRALKGSALDRRSRRKAENRNPSI